MLLSVIIPAYQEEATIGEVLARVGDVDTEALGFEKEIVVCDDGSRDGTVGVIEEAAARDGRVRLVRHVKNRGKGAAIRTALAAASGDYCLIQDADLEYDPEDYPAILEKLRQGAHAVYGSRFLEASWPEGMKLPNYLANRMLAITSNLLYGVQITDEATCFKAFRTDLLRRLELECEGFEFCPEVTAKLGKAGVTIEEVPVQYRARNTDQGKKVRWTDGIEAMWVLAKHRLKRS